MSGYLSKAARGSATPFSLITELKELKNHEVSQGFLKFYNASSALSKLPHSFLIGFTHCRRMSGFQRIAAY